MFYKFAKIILKFFSYIFFPLKVHGNPSDIPEGGVVLCANHISFFDVVFLIIAFKRQIRFVGKKLYAENFILKPLFKLIGAFSIDPEKPDLTAIKNCFRVIKEKEVLGIFPEGTRILNGKVSDPMPGALMIAHKTKAPLFYVRIKPSKGVFKVFHKTDLYIGKAVCASELGVTNGKNNEYKCASQNLIKLVYRLGEE